MKDLESNRSNEPTIAIHTLPKTTDQAISRFLDGGRLVDDLNERGYSVTITNRDVFDETAAARRVLSNDEGFILEPITTDTTAFHAMHSRLSAPVRRAGTEHIPKLNSNSLKELSGSKIELYRQVLSDYQVPTHFISMRAEDFAATADLVHAVATEKVILKSNAGFGGTSTRVFEKADAIAWVAEQIEAGNDSSQILQPKIEFGRLPDGIRGVGDEAKHLIERARQEKLLTELRFFAMKNNDTIDTIPVLRVVPDVDVPMQGSNDKYIEIDLDDDLRDVLDETTRTIVKKAINASGNETHVVGAVDYYFDIHGLPHVMEANFRTPVLPETSLLPRSGRLAYGLLANMLVDIADGETRTRIENDDKKDGGTYA